MMELYHNREKSILVDCNSDIADAFLLHYRIMQIVYGGTVFVD